MQHLSAINTGVKYSHPPPHPSSLLSPPRSPIKRRSSDVEEAHPPGNNSMPVHVMGGGGSNSASSDIPQGADEWKESKAQSMKAGEGRSSDWAVIYHIVCIVAGTGMLGLPHAIKTCGWMGVVLVLMCACMSNYTGILLIRCLYTPTTRCTSYADLGDVAFGWWGRWTVQLFHSSNLLGSSMIYLIVAGMNLDTLTGIHLGTEIWFECDGGGI